MRAKRLWRTLPVLTLACLTGCNPQEEYVQLELPPPTTPLSANSIFYYLGQGDIPGAFALYQRRQDAGLEHDFALLHEMGLRVLEQGTRNADPEVQVLSIAGTQLAWSDDSLALLEEAAYSKTPAVQITAMYALAQHGDRRAVLPISRGMGSPYLPIRLEAARMLTFLQSDDALGQVEALLSKLPPEFAPYFPPLFAAMESPAATSRLRRLVHHESASVAASALHSIAMNGRDDLIDDVRHMATQFDPMRQEAAVAALGALGDSQSLETLNRLSSSPTLHVRLAALLSLRELNDQSAASRLIQEARDSRDPFAIYLLSDIETSRDVLVELLEDRNIEVRTNAALALLEHRDIRCLPQILDVLLEDARDLAILPMRSPGAALIGWSVVPSSHQRFGRDPAALAESLATREEILAKLARLPGPHFYGVVEEIVNNYQRALLPTAFQLLEQRGSDEAIALLQRMQLAPGRPLARTYASLALYRLNVPGPYLADLRAWLRDTQRHDLIQFRPHRPMNEYALVPFQELTPVETSRLLLEVTSAIAEKQDQEGIDALLALIIEGNPKNRYALVGLLMRATT